MVVVVDCSLASGCVNGDESQPGKRGADAERKASWVCNSTVVVVRGRERLNCERGASNGEL